MSLSFSDLPPDMIAGAVIQNAQVAVCPTLKMADVIAGAMNALRRGSVDPMIYTFACAQYMVVVMGEVTKGAKDGAELSY